MIAVVVYSAMIKPELRRPPSQAIPIRSHDSATTKFRTLIHSQSESEVVCVTVAGEAPSISHLPSSPSFLPSSNHILPPTFQAVHNLPPSSHLLLLSCHLLVPSSSHFLLPTSSFPSSASLLPPPYYYPPFPPSFHLPTLSFLLAPSFRYSF